MVHDLQAESQTIVLKAIAGEIDMQGRRLGGMQNSVLLLASRADGKYTVNTRDRMLVARNGVVFIQAWLDLQLEREGSQEVRRWLEAKKTKVERQLTKLDRQIKSEERRSQRA